MDFSDLKEKIRSLFGKKSDDADSTKVVEIKDQQPEGEQEVDADLLKPEPDKKKLLIRGFLIVVIVVIGADMFLNKDGGDLAQDEVIENLPDAPATKKELTKKQPAPKPEVKPAAKVGAVMESKPVVEKKPMAIQELAVRPDMVDKMSKTAVKPVENPIAELEVEDKKDTEAKLKQKLGEKKESKIDNTVIVKKIKEPEVDKEKSYLKLLRDIKINPEKTYEKPNYLRSGRGLVYDCEKKRWVCVDRVNYLRCASVQKFDQEKGRKPSCVSRDVFYSSEHCSRGQLKKIHKGITVEECG